MSAPILTADEATKANIELITNGRGTQAVHDAVVAMQANRRSGTANTKTKAQVALSGAKPYRQKGTGRARAGYKSSPVWTGGGVAFGPKPRSYAKKVPKKTRRLAFRKALSSRILAGDVLITDLFCVEEAKTKKFLLLLKDLIPLQAQESIKSHSKSRSKSHSQVLIVNTSFDQNTYQAARNVSESLLVLAQDLNTEQLLAFDKILLTRSALAIIAERLSK